MRNPEGKRNLALIAFGLSAATVVWGFFDPPQKDTWLGGLLVLDVTAAFFLLCGVIVCQINLVRQGRLLSGENVIARWRVDPQRWKAFVDLDKEIAAQPNTRANWLSLRAAPGPDGGEVIIGKHCIQVDGEFEMLDTGTLTGIEWIAGPPPALQLNIHVYDPNGTDVDKVFRIPIATHAETDAKRVLEYFSSR